MRVKVTVGVTLSRGRRASDEIKIVGEEFRLAKRGRVGTPRMVVLEFGEGERILLSDPVLNTRVA